VSRSLEIAPGFGRWTHFLRDLCSELIIVDIAERAAAVANLDALTTSG